MEGVARFSCFIENGGWAGLSGCFGASIGAPGDVWVYNCIDLNGNCYGTAESKVRRYRMGRNTNGWLSGVNIHILNNTSGNKIDALQAGYNTAVALIPNIEPGYTGEIRNNISLMIKIPGNILATLNIGI